MASRNWLFIANTFALMLVASCGDGGHPKGDASFGSDGQSNGDASVPDALDAGADAAIDGTGETAIRQEFPSDGLYDMSFVDANTGWAVGSGLILATTDAGKTWTIQQKYGPNSLFGVSFVDAKTGWAVGANGSILATTNGG